MIIHGKKDPVIPFELSYELEKIIQGEKLSWYPEEGKHLDTFFSHHMNYREKLLNVLGEEGYKNQIHNLSKDEQNLLQKKYCKLPDYKAYADSLSQKFLESSQQFSVPPECEESCLCNFYADLLKKLGSRRLSQSMYRQNSLSDEVRENKCQEKIKALCSDK